ncbi:MAG: peptidylprolyl isomerase [Candidatus Saccharibacteria bacterium]
MKQKLKQILAKRPKRRSKDPENSLEQAIRGIPRITNETVAEHREEVLSSARKYIYPLQHSAHRVVVISSTLAVVGVVAFSTYSILSLYRFNSTSTFIYRVSQVIPFPVAKAGTNYVSYENYLFELRHYIHYYQTQQKVDFNSTSGKQQLQAFRERALNEVVDSAYVKQLAAKNKISVSGQEISDQIALIQAQNGLTNNEKVFEDVLNEFWGWSIDDFKRELSQQMLAQKVVDTLDTGTHQQASAVLAKVQAGQDFAALAAQYSQDKNTAAAGGAYGLSITRTNRDIPAQVVNELFKLQVGQTSGIINTGTSLEIVKLDDSSAGTVKASHISFIFNDINTYIKPLRDKEKPTQYIHP